MRWNLAGTTWNSLRIADSRRQLIMLGIAILMSTSACDNSVAPELEIGDGAHIGNGASAEATTSRYDRRNAVLIWGEACLESIRATKHGPPMTARSLAMVHTAMYDAWAAYDHLAVGTRLGGGLRRPADEHTTENKTKAISYAAFRILVDLFPSRTQIFAETMRQLGFDPGHVSDDPALPEGVGQTAAEAVLEFRHLDGANQLAGYADYTGYRPINPPLDPALPGVGKLIDPERWQPLVHSGIVQEWIVPHWEHVIPFAITSSDQFIPAPPAGVNSGDWHRQVEELIHIQARLTDRQKVIAEYWADGPSSEFPPGHWCTIAQYVSHRDGHSLDDDVKLLFLVANAVFDASIAAWTAKIRYDYVRPITAVRYVKDGKKIRAWAGPGKGTQVIDGEAWIPYQVASFRTPPFAEYVSGHSTFSAASATVLRLFTGSDTYGDCATFPTGASKVEPGLVPAQPVTLCWKTFTEAAQEAGISRLYGGIHFRQGNLEGQRIGRLVGEQVWATASRYFNGTASPI